MPCMQILRITISRDLHTDNRYEGWYVGCMHPSDIRDVYELYVARCRQTKSTCYVYDLGCMHSGEWTICMRVMMRLITRMQYMSDTCLINQAGCMHTCDFMSCMKFASKAGSVLSCDTAV